MEQLIEAIINKHHTVDVSKESNLDMIQIDPNSYHVLYENKSHHVVVKNIDHRTKTILLEIDERPYEICYKDSVDVMIDKMGLKDIVGKGTEDCLAPMPGLVLSVEATEGSTVEVGQALLILEAMKMENVIKASHDGTIDKIFIQEGDKVEKNQVLISFVESTTN